MVKIETTAYIIPTRFSAVILLRKLEFMYEGRAERKANMKPIR